MSIYSRIKSESPLEEIDKYKTPFSRSNTNKGYECLVFEDDEILYDGGGHYIKFYPNGALMVLKESCKYYPDSKSFMFFNNNGEKVFEMYNSIKVKNSSHQSDFLPPEKDIEVTIYNGHILVKEISLIDGSEEEYFISVKSGKKIIDVGSELDKDQNRTELDKDNQYTMIF